MLVFKKHGFLGTVRIICQKIVVKTNKAAYWFFRLTHKIDNSLIVFESEGDCSDNAYALFRYLKNQGLVGKYSFVWLVSHVEDFQNEPYVSFAYKNWEKLDLKRAKALAVCRYYIYDHGNVLEGIESRDGQKVIFLTHGCGFKAGFLENLSFKTTADEAYDIGKFYHEVMATHMHCRLEGMMSLGYPRTDFFYEEIGEDQKKFIQRFGFDKYKKVLLWMPTFRRSQSKTIDESYFDHVTGLPILENEDQLYAFDVFLRELNILCVFKVHHLQAKLETFKKCYSNILILSDEKIIKNGLQLYQVVMLTDFLITDYSSIANDYLLLDRPIIYTLDDYEDYEKSRGFSFSNVKDYMPGYHVVNRHELENAIQEIVEGRTDKYKEQRARVVSIIYDHRDGKSSERIAKHLGLI